MPGLTHRRQGGLYSLIFILRLQYFAKTIYFKEDEKTKQTNKKTQKLKECECLIIGFFG